MKRFLYILIAMCFSGALLAQHQNLRIGVTVSPHFSWLNPDSKRVNSEGTKPGFQGGLVVENYFSDNYAFTTGLTIGSFGGKLSYSDTISMETNDGMVQVLPNDEISYKLQYISIPLGLKMKTNRIGYFTYYAQMGLTAQFNIKAKATSAVLENQSINKEVNLLSMSYYFGGGLEYNIGGNTSVILGVRYDNGFMDCLKTERSKDNLNYVTIHIGVMF